MTIDKLIKALEGEREFGDVWIDDEKAKVIVAALRAGQAMRSDLQEFVGTEPATLKGFQSCDEWDAATKEEV